jgi:hypothetical protein
MADVVQSTCAVHPGHGDGEIEEYGTRYPQTSSWLRRARHPAEDRHLADIPGKPQRSAQPPSRCPNRVQLQSLYHRPASEFARCTTCCRPSTELQQERCILPTSTRQSAVIALRRPNLPFSRRRLRCCLSSGTGCLGFLLRGHETGLLSQTCPNYNPALSLFPAQRPWWKSSLCWTFAGKSSCTNWMGQRGSFRSREPTGRWRYALEATGRKPKPRSHTYRTDMTFFVGVAFRFRRGPCAYFLERDLREVVLRGGGQNMVRGVWL